MKQFNMFGNIEPQKEERKYTTKIESPIYEPKNQKPHILELYDNQKTKRLVREIDQSSLPIEEKMFLVDAARRHTIFNYEKIADYYANASLEMQSFMEKSALVIIDFEKAIEYGYVKMCDDIRTQYLEEYGD
jgi:hypothetical protein